MQWWNFNCLKRDNFYYYYYYCLVRMYAIRTGDVRSWVGPGNRPVHWIILGAVHILTCKPGRLICFLSMRNLPGIRSQR